MIEDRAFESNGPQQGLLNLKNTVVFVVVIYLMSLNHSHAQIIWAGIKAGGQLNMVKLDAPGFRDTVNSLPTLGFNAGGALSFRVKDRYFLQTEYTYSLKRKTIKSNGRFDPLLEDKVSYHYFEIPVLFTMQFKIFTGEEKKFKCYAGAGPNLAYLVAARGRLKSSELTEEGFDPLTYKISFTERKNRDHTDVIHYPTDTKRFQFGINVGAGIILEPQPKRKVIIDFRYTFDQTQFAKTSANNILPHDYRDNLKFRNRTLRISIMYLLQYNLDKKVRNKGKSNLPKSR